MVLHSFTFAPGPTERTIPVPPCYLCLVVSASSFHLNREPNDTTIMCSLHALFGLSFFAHHLPKMIAAIAENFFFCVLGSPRPAFVSMQTTCVQTDLRQAWSIIMSHLIGLLAKKKRAVDHTSNKTWIQWCFGVRWSSPRLCGRKSTCRNKTFFPNSLSSLFVVFKECMFATRIRPILNSGLCILGPYVCLWLLFGIQYPACHGRKIRFRVLSTSLIPAAIIGGVN
ncbi:hypothetical protein BC939DRAFT_131817 [Gamsiella multidivaricata]|uniref:uncharacterized protein n=1 Tax=Gamsiella multidivaricata TaxID=101098 RepID=UPI0022207E99|nr:uncharacterized protein BC939DRAFT_131817 [Gamsiella multidivaricata]KAI7825171.1 hypothetical protein BC939DRAFT_131817 [Gamsiella multidivaricata]